MAVELNDVNFDMPVDPGCADLGLNPVMNVPDSFGPRVLTEVTGALSRAKALFESIESTEAALNKASPKLVQSKRHEGPEFGGRNRETTLIALPHGREHEYQATLDKAFESTRDYISARISEVNGCIQKMREQIDSKVLDPDALHVSKHIVAGEIRGYVRGLKGEERTKFIHDSIEAEDRKTVFAVIHAPGYLSGLSKQEHETFTEQAKARWAPVPYEQVQEALKFRNLIERSYLTLQRRYEKSKEMKTNPQMKASAELANLQKMVGA